MNEKHKLLLCNTYNNKKSKSACLNVKIIEKLQRKYKQTNQIIFS